MSKIEECWVVQRDDGKFYTECSVKDIKFTSSIWCAMRCDNKNEAEWCIKGIKDLQNCKPVKVEIKVVGE